MSPPNDSTPPPDATVTAAAAGPQARRGGRFSTLTTRRHVPAAGPARPEKANRRADGPGASFVCIPHGGRKSLVQAAALLILAAGCGSR